MTSGMVTGIAAVKLTGKTENITFFGDVKWRWYDPLKY